MKAIRFYLLMVLVIPVILAIEVPTREIIRAWKNSKIFHGYRYNITAYIREWKVGP